MKVLHRFDQIQEDLFKAAVKINTIVTGKNGLGNNTVCLPILQGAAPFFTDISRHFAWDPIVDYVGASSYDGTTRQMINAYKLPKPNLITGNPVLLFDDILDSGNTIDFFINTCYSLGATTVIPIVLLKRKATEYKQDPRVPVIISVYDIDDEWVWGYGMDDANGRARTHKHILYDEPKSEA